MGKQKVHKGLKKRIKVTGTGKINRKKAFKGHLMSSKTSKRRRQLGGTATMTKALTATAKRALCVS